MSATANVGINANLVSSTGAAAPASKTTIAAMTGSLVASFGDVATNAGALIPFPTAGWSAWGVFVLLILSGDAGLTVSVYSDVGLTKLISGPIPQGGFIALWNPPSTIYIVTSATGNVPWQVTASQP